ncbi:SMR family transporter [Microvirga terrestris]|uniref:EamA family transporter n=1 Tax=Microvirga terrestris TaxID=2791024 RepID=A0ABS0HPF4_9HYPH|nr:EamA family transporter [Microvirga terrestris]
MNTGAYFGCLWALLAIVLNALASTLLKFASGSSLASLLALDSPRTLLLLVGAITSYGCAFVAYFMTLRYMPLGIAYILITAGASLVIALISFLILNERLIWMQILGFALSISGLYLIVASPSLASR